MVQISDVMSTFSHISQSLRTGEPLHRAQYQNLLDRLHYHGDVAYSAYAQETQERGRKEAIHAVTSYEYMFYASGIVAVFQVLEVSA